jgi:putative phosphoribosyl transferase
MAMRFVDRTEAGRLLARRLEHLRGGKVVVLGLPRGGVPVAFEVAQALHAPLDVIVVRKLGVPFQPELALGAIGEDGVRVLNPDVLHAARIDAEELTGIERAARVELTRRVERLRGGRPREPLAGRTVVIVDDGVATGATARAACRVAAAQGAAGIVLAMPVAAADVVAALRQVADDVVCVHMPVQLLSISRWYDDFAPTSDDEVAALLDRARGLAAGAEPDADGEVVIDAGPVRLPARLAVPAGARLLVVFAHGSGSSRHSPRNRYVADRLAQAGLATLLVDLLTPTEERDRRNVFDIPLLARRLGKTIQWANHHPETRDLAVGLFGASTGAGAALWAAAEAGPGVAAVVSRGGRPDLASDRLGQVRAPTLFIVGGRDVVVLDLNRTAQRRLHCPNRLVVVRSATHLFEEPGALHEVADLARDWFVQHTPVPLGPMTATG